MYVCYLAWPPASLAHVGTQWLGIVVDSERLSLAAALGKGSWGQTGHIAAVSGCLQAADQLLSLEPGGLGVWCKDLAAADEVSS